MSVKQVTSLSVHLLTQKAPIYRCIITAFSQVTCVVKMEVECSSQVYTNSNRLVVFMVYIFFGFCRV